MGSHWRIAARMLVIVTGLAAGVVITYAIAIAAQNQTLLAEREATLVNLVQLAESVAIRYYEQSEIGAMTEAEAQAAALEGIRAMRYGDRNYLWVQDEAAVMLMHPNRDLEGQDLGGLADVDGVRPIAALAEAGRNGRYGSVHFRWPRAASDEPIPKLSVAQGFAPWGWVICTGVYIDDIGTVSQEMAVELGAVVLIILATMTGLTLLVTWHRPAA